MATTLGYHEIVVKSTAYANFAVASERNISVVIPEGLVDGIIVVAIACRGANPVTIVRDGQTFYNERRGTEYDGCDTHIFYLRNPNVGTANVVVTMSASDWSVVGVVVAEHVEGRSKFNPVLTYATSGRNASYCNNVLINPLAGALAVDVQSNTGTAAGNPSTGQTKIVGSADNDAGGISYEVGIPLGSQNVGWSGFQTSDTASSSLVVAFAPARKRSNMALAGFLGLLK